MNTTTPDEFACAQLSIRANHCADMHDIDGFLALFTDDGEIRLRGKILSGKDALLKFMQGRPRERITRHLLTLPVVDVVRPGQEARGTCFFTLFEAQANEADLAPYPLRDPTVVGENQDIYRMTEKGWRIASRTVSPIFSRDKD